MTDPQIRALAVEILNLKRAGHARATQLEHTALEDGAIREFSLEGQQVAQYGQQFDGTSTAATLVSPPPPTPKTPTVTGVPGGLRVAWDGTYGDDITTVAPMDWRQTDVVVGPVGMDPIATPPMVAFTSPRGGETFVPCEPGQYAVALVSRTLAGRPSAPSPVVQATALALVDSAQFEEALVDLTEAEGRLDLAETALDANETEIAAAKARLTEAEADATQALADAIAASQAAAGAATAAGNASTAAQAAQEDADAAATLAGLAQTAAGTAQSRGDAAHALATSATTLASSKVTAFRQASAPSTTGRTNGDLWVDSDDGLLYIWTGSWTVSPDQRIATVVASNALKTTAFSQTSAPATTGRTVGDIWIDTDDGNLIYVWDGAWTARRDATIAAAAALATTAQSTAAGKLTAYRQSSAPTGTFVVGDLWFDIDDGLVYYASTTAGGWTLHADQRIALVVTSNATKTTVFAQTSQPPLTGRTIGDLWIDTDDGNKLYDWNGAWGARLLGAPAISATARQLGAITIYRQSAPPASGMVSNDLWVDSDDGLLYVYATTPTAGWVLSADQRVAALVTSNATKTTAFAQTSPPSTTGRTVGDLWLDTDDGNRPYVWDGAWTDRRDATIAAAASLATAAKAAADSKITVYRQSSQPGAGTYVVGDLWLDIDDGQTYYASTTAGGWTLHADQRISLVVSSNAAKTTVFAQTSSPPLTGRTVGDLWIDTDENDRMYRWSGSAFVLTDIASIAYIQSRGTNLITNGTGLLGNNRNFSAFTFDPADAPEGAAGSFLVDTTALTQVKWTDELVPVDPSKTYRMSFQAKQKLAGGKGRVYGALMPVDGAGQIIGTQHYTYLASTDTTLAQPLTPGQTTVTLTSAAGWRTLASARYMIAWNWVDSFGKTWPIGTYSRNAPLYTEINGNVLTLSAPYSGPPLAAGHPVSNSNTGGTYMYLVSNEMPAESWTPYAGTLLAGTHDASTGAVASSRIPSGTSFVKLGFLVNYGITAQDAPSKIAFAALSFSDAAAAQATADAANSLATLAKSTADGKITVFRQASAPALTGRTLGDLWIDTDDGLVSVWTGAWTPSPDQRIAAVVTSNATKTTVFAQISQPPTTGRTVGDIWLDTDDGNKIYDWSGSWTVRLIGAPAIGATARQLGAITVYRQSSQPGAGTYVVGDLWVDIDDGLFYVATTTAGGWTLHSDQRISQVVTATASKTTVFVQTSQPPTTGRTVGDLWLDSDDGNKPYDWTTAWTARQFGDSALANLDLNKLTVVGTANLNIAVAQHIAAKTAAFQQVDIGNLTVTETATMDQVVAQRIAAEVGEFVTVRANNLESTMALVTTLTSGGEGRRWEASPDGIRVYEPDGTLLINFPTDPDTPASFYGDLVATSLTVADQLAIRGLVNEVSKGAQLVLATGTTAPSGSPTVVVDWEQISTSVGGGEYEGFNPDRNGLVRWNGAWAMLDRGRWSKAHIQRYTDAGVFDRYHAQGNIETGFHGAEGGITVIGTTVYVMGQESLSWGVTQWVVEGYNTAGARVSRWIYPHNATHRQPKLTSDGTYLVVCYSVNEPAAKLRYQKYVAATGAPYQAERVMTNGGIDKEMATAWWGTGDLGALRLIITLEGDPTLYSHDPVNLVRTSEDNFPSATSSVRGIDYYNGFFWTHDPAAKKLTKHTTIKWGATETSTWHVSNTWYDSNATGATHETAQGPTRAFTMKKRARITLTSGLLPVRPIPNTPDDAVATRFYIGRGSSAPVRTQMERVATPADGVRTVTLSAVTLPAVGVNAAAPPPAASNFPAESPGRIISADGTSLVMNGDGSGTWGGMAMVGGTNPGVTSLHMRTQQSKASGALTLAAAGVQQWAAGPGLTFIAPASGMVEVVTEAFVKAAGDGQSTSLTYEIRNGAVLRSGAVFVTGNANDGAVNYNVQYVKSMGSKLVTGLTPGTTYNVYAYVSSGNIGAIFTAAGITVRPSF